MKGVHRQVVEKRWRLKLEFVGSPDGIHSWSIVPAGGMVHTIDIERLNVHCLSSIAVSSIDQAGVDRLVDGLRTAELSILRMERARPSLEQVFMNIVGAAKS